MRAPHRMEDFGADPRRQVGVPACRGTHCRRIHGDNKKEHKTETRRNLPKNPANTAEIPFPLIYDNGSATNRVLVFGFKVGLRLLHGASTWFMDETHSTAPQQFTQVFTVRVELGETSATAAYALLPSKTQEVYEECLTAILDACLEQDIRPSPVKIVADYEVAIHNAVHAAVSPNIRIQDCFYHLTQSTWRHLQSEGLAATYKSDPNVRHFCGT